MTDLKEFKRIFKPYFKMVEYGKPDCIELEVANRVVNNGSAPDIETKTVQFQFDKQSGICLGFDYE